jgi:tRNA modification GTPase
VIFLTAPNSEKEANDLRAQILEALPAKCPILELINKSDLLDKDSADVNGKALLISAKTGEGIEVLKQKILEAVGWNGPQEGAIIARRRHLDCLERAAQHIEKAEKFAANGNNSLELFAEELFLAQNHLGQITGKLLPDDLLGKIFSQFCIGK